jgi:hypothetical protein
MSNMNLPIVLLSVGGCLVYVWSMSALGRWLAVCREESTVAYVAPAGVSTIVA